MTLSTSKGNSALAAFPHTLSSIAITVGGLAMFLVFASWLLVSFPVGATVRGYFYSVDSSKRVELLNPPVIQANVNGSIVDGVVNVVDNNPPSKLVSDDNETSSNESVIQTKVSSSVDNNTANVVENSPPTELVSHDSVASNDESVVSVKGGKEAPSTGSSVVFSKSPQGSDAGNSTTNAVDSMEEDKPPLSVLPKNLSDAQTVGVSRADSGNFDCDLYQGSWFYDPLGPLYTNNSCPVLTQMQNCQGNGRPDKEYENWRWKPYGCDLPRFDAKKFLALMKGKTLAFIGDSVARNQMESLLCLLWQVEVPKNRGNRRMQRWYFRSNSVMIVRIWSSWLVHQTSEPLDFAPEGVVKLHLDLPDKNIMEFIPKFDVVVLSSGHWFAKQSAYVLDNKIVGGQLWWPDKSRPMKVNNVEAFGISVETIFSAIATHPNYTGLAILRTWSPDHYEGGAWNTGGSCTGKVHPLAPGQLVENGFTNVMHEKQVTGFKQALKKATNKSKLALMDITEVFAYRHDGHPGPYRNPDPNKITKRGPDGRPPPQDCLHWCMPGPVDTWNELVLEIIRREFQW